MPVLFVYVLIAGELIVKLGYVPVTVEAPAPVKVTVWSGAVLAIIDPEVIEMPVLFVYVLTAGVFTVKVFPEEVTVAEPIPVMVGVIAAATVGELMVKLG